MYPVRAGLLSVVWCLARIGDLLPCLRWSSTRSSRGSAGRLSDRTRLTFVDGSAPSASLLASGDADGAEALSPAPDRVLRARLNAPACHPPRVARSSVEGVSRPRASSEDADRRALILMTRSGRRPRTGQASTMRASMVAMGMRERAPGQQAMPGRRLDTLAAKREADASGAPARAGCSCRGSFGRAPGCVGTGSSR